MSYAWSRPDGIPSSLPFFGSATYFPFQIVFPASALLFVIHVMAVIATFSNCVSMLLAGNG